MHARQQDGGALSRAALTRSGWVLAEEEWWRLIGFLERERLVCATGNGDWVLCRDLSQLSLGQLLRRWPEPLPRSLPERLPDGLRAAWYPRLRGELLALALAQEERLGGKLADWLREPAGDE